MGPTPKVLNGLQRNSFSSYLVASLQFGLCNSSLSHSGAQNYELITGTQRFPGITLALHPLSRLRPELASSSQGLGWFHHKTQHCFDLLTLCLKSQAAATTPSPAPESPQTLGPLPRAPLTSLRRYNYHKDIVGDEGFWVIGPRKAKHPKSRSPKGSVQPELTCPSSSQPCVGSPPCCHQVGLSVQGLTQGEG